MAALNFPPSPTDGQLYPSPAEVGIGQWSWSSVNGYWTEVPFYVRLQSGGYNNYTWPTTDGSSDQQLETDGSGGLFWATGTGAQFRLLGLLEPFDSFNVAFTLVDLGTSTPYSPAPSTNIAVFLGGVPQIPVAAYSVSTNTITFTEAPLIGATFYAISTTPN
jgi:hypothetical protein